MSQRRVVVTGLGAVSPVGNNVKESWEAIKAGKSGVDKITLFDASDYPVQIDAEVKNFSIEQYGLEKKILRKINRQTRFLLGASIEAVNDGVLTGAELKDYMKSDSLANRALKLFVEDSKEFVRTEGTDAAAMDTQVVNYVGAQIAKIVAIVIAVIVMFVIIRIAILLLAKLFDALSKNKVVSGIDRAVGLLFGLIKGSILVCIVLAVFYLIANQTVLNWIDGSTITKWVYTYVCEFVEFLVSKFNLPKQITELFPQLTSGK